MANKTQAQVDATTTQAATGKTYMVQSNGSGPKGMKAGDKVVTSNGTYQVNSVRPDGSYDSKLVDKNQTLTTYKGAYATPASAKTPSYAKKYDKNMDYTAQIEAARAAGDLPAAAYFEQQRNAKIAGQKLQNQWKTTNTYSQYLSQLTPERQAQLANGYVRDTTAMTYNPTNEINGLLDAWKQGAIDQQNAQIDYAVEQQAKELQRAYDDSLPQYQEQRDQVAIDAARAQDNSALYAQARGDNGGIGQSQYNEIQANALKSNQLINNAQVKAATDTARAIADLRAQGEFQKADAYREITQQYLSQLMELKWKGAQYGLTLEQMQQDMEAREKSYQIQLSQITGTFNGQPTYAAQKNDQATALSLVEALYKTGQPVSKELLAAAGLGQFGGDISRLSNIYASSFSSGGSGGGGSSGGGSSRGRGSGSGGSGAGVPAGSTGSLYVDNTTAAEKAAAAARLTGNVNKKTGKAADMSAAVAGDGYLSEYTTLASDEKYWSQLESEANSGMSASDQLLLLNKWRNEGKIGDEAYGQMVEAYHINDAIKKKKDRSNKATK